MQILVSLHLLRMYAYLFIKGVTQCIFRRGVWDVVIFSLLNGVRTQFDALIALLVFFSVLRIFMICLSMCVYNF